MNYCAHLCCAVVVKWRARCQSIRRKITQVPVVHVIEYCGAAHGAHSAAVGIATRDQIDGSSMVADGWASLRKASMSFSRTLRPLTVT